MIELLLALVSVFVVLLAYLFVSGTINPFKEDDERKSKKPKKQKRQKKSKYPDFKMSLAGRKYSSQTDNEE